MCLRSLDLKFGLVLRVSSLNLVTFSVVRLFVVRFWHCQVSYYNVAMFRPAYFRGFLVFFSRHCASFYLGRERSLSSLKFGSVINPLTPVGYLISESYLPLAECNPIALMVLVPCVC